MFSSSSHEHRREGSEVDIISVKVIICPHTIVPGPWSIKSARN